MEKNKKDLVKKNKKIASPPNSRRKKFIVGRGIGSKKGKTAGRGTKGYKSRKGNGKNLGFEGGQMPLIRRLPKFGFSNEPHKLKFRIIKVGILEKKFADGEEVNLNKLFEKKLISSKVKLVKIVNGGLCSIKLKFSSDIRMTSSVRKLFGIVSNENNNQSKDIDNKNSRPQEGKEISDLQTNN